MTPAATRSTQANAFEGTTQHVRRWSANESTPTPDLMGAFTAATDAVARRTPVESEPLGHEAAAGFRVVFEWAMRQDFPPDHAQRMRREAWGDNEPQ